LGCGHRVRPAGDGISGFIQALRKRHDQLRYIHVPHEEVAAMAAVGYAQFTGRLGGCFTTASPGAIHLLNGLVDARVEQAPVLAITEMTYHDYQAAPVDSGSRFRRNVAGHTSTTYRPSVRVPLRQDLEAAAMALQGKTKVAILAGVGARGAAEELEAVAEKLAAPVIKA
jgi:thiamine pyrophosphate-dependent acetolactate synthase large subunit-like protein